MRNRVKEAARFTGARSGVRRTRPARSDAAAAPLNALHDRQIRFRPSE
jgi:hypothetical protein